MPFLELLPLRRIATDVAVRDKPALIALLSTLLASSADERELVRDALSAREALGSTGLGRGVAIPHGRSAEIDAPRAAFVRLSSPIAFGAPDAQPVDLIAALVVPSHFTDQHLQLLAELAEMFSSEELTLSLRSAPDADALRRKLAKFGKRRKSD